ncbi:hypothetical protein BH11PSE7_BH11PSE7_03380 [soil metagenome]
MAGPTISANQQRNFKMSFALYMVGFIIFLAGIIWGASVAGVPQLYIGIGALIILGIGIFSAVARTRSKDPS